MTLAGVKFARCRDLLRELQSLDAQGRGDSEDAERVREQIEADWAGLDARARGHLAGLSHDLYSLSGTEPRLEDADPIQDFTHFKHHFEAKEWEEALVRLRGAHSELPGEKVAYLRGRCWYELGEPRIASWFFRRAEELDPDNPSLAGFILDALDGGGQTEELFARARETLNAVPGSTRLVGAAASAVLRHRDRAPSELMELVVRRVEACIDAEALLPPRDMAQPVLHTLRMSLAFALDFLGLPGAPPAYDALVKNHPDSQDALIARALYRLGRSDPSAFDDFELAIRNGATSFYPYYYLAFRRLSEQLFLECIALCDAALVRTDDRTIRAEILQWEAIARAELGGDSRVVRELLADAAASDPFNPDIDRANQLMFGSPAAEGARLPPPKEPRSKPRDEQEQMTRRLNAA